MTWTRRRGTSDNALTTNYYYDHRGDLVAESDPGGLWTKDVYDGAGRLVYEYTTDGAGGTTWTDANSVADDHVLEQTQYVYDADGNDIEEINRLRLGKRHRYRAFWEHPLPAWLRRCIIKLRPTTTWRTGQPQKWTWATMAISARTTPCRLVRTPCW